MPKAIPLVENSCPIAHSPHSQNDQDFPRHSLSLLFEVTRLPTGDALAESPLASASSAASTRRHGSLSRSLTVPGEGSPAMLRVYGSSWRARKALAGTTQ